MEKTIVKLEFNHQKEGQIIKRVERKVFINGEKVYTDLVDPFKIPADDAIRSFEKWLLRYEK